MANESMCVLDPIGVPSVRPQQLRKVLSGLDGKVIGFIDNGKPNFHYLVDDLEKLLMQKYGVSSVVRHRKRGSVPIGDAAIKSMVDQCDAIITGSGD